VSRAELGRLVGKARSTVTEACQGPLAPACDGRRIDAAHPAVLRYAGVSSYEQLVRKQRGREADVSPEFALSEKAFSLELLASHVKQPVAAVERAVAAAIIPASHVAVDTFARLAGCSTSDATKLLRGELAGAVTPAGRVDLLTALPWFAAHPFERSRGEPVTDGFPLGSACVGEHIDSEHPVSLVFLARCWGRVPSEAGT
jgi:hypothetical protein